ncbi:MAG: hypothetical protein DHS20C16_37360 [Phycisphaerae bacterium]|nr:MAG: hypothetical protein DHS20C16_37360 [Phycisphaerae bacterium]
MPSADTLFGEKLELLPGKLASPWKLAEGADSATEITCDSVVRNAPHVKAL